MCYFHSHKNYFIYQCNIKEFIFFFYSEELKLEHVLWDYICFLGSKLYQKSWELMDCYLQYTVLTAPHDSPKSDLKVVMGHQENFGNISSSSHHPHEYLEAQCSHSNTEGQSKLATQAEQIWHQHHTRN